MAGSFTAKVPSSPGNSVVGRLSTSPALGASGPITLPNLLTSLLPMINPNNLVVPGTGLVGSSSGNTLTLSLLHTGTPVTGTVTVGLSGDATGSASGAGSSPTITIPVTLDTVNTNIGTYNNVTINGKGQATGGTNVSYLTGNQTITISGDVSGSGATAITATLPTVNTNVGTYNNVTINGKGQATGGSNVAYLTGNQTISLTGAVTGSGATSISTVIPATSTYILVGNASNDAVPVAMSGDATLSNTGAITLASVNSNVGTFQGITFSAKGLATSAVNQGYWVANADWTFSGNDLIGNASGATAPTILVNDCYLQLIGTTSGSPGLQVNTYQGFCGFVGARADGTPGSPATIAAAENMLLFRAYGYNGSSYVEGARIGFSSSAAWTTSVKGTFIDFYTTATASNTITANMRLNNDGGLSLPSTAASEGSGTVNVATGYYIAASNIQTAKAATSKTTASPGSVTATSATYKMLGFAGTITPKWNPAIMLTITGSVTDATLGDTITLVASYGTGVAPSNGGALAGTQTGSVYAFAQAVASDATGFSISVVITSGLTAGTATWLDLAVGSAGGHAITFGSTNISAHEI